MRKYNFTLIITLLLSFTSCNLMDIDNYDAPNAKIQGGIYDVETGELVEQDIVNGMEIEYMEYGFDNPHIQRMLVKCNGTYQNNLMFAAKYSMQPVRGNFASVEKQDVTINTGDNIVNFYVLPYIRIKNLTISKENNIVVARFKLEKTVPNNVKTISLFISDEPNVGNYLKDIAVNENINADIDAEKMYELTFDLANTSLSKGKKYYFRVGALINISDAKYNYASAVRLDI